MKGLKLNIGNFLRLQGKRSETDMAKQLGISRSQLWRLKCGSHVGGNTLSRFKERFPDEKIDDFFFFG